MATTWTPNRGLIDNGWNFFSLVDNDDQRFLDIQSERFASTLRFETTHGTEMYVRGFPEIPKDQNPNGGFIQFGCRTPNEPVDESYMSGLKQAFKQLTGKESTSSLVLPGPFYTPSNIAKGQFERVTGYDKIIWMR